MNKQLSSETLDHIIKLIKNGELVVIPTETVYGLAADASNPEAVKKIFKAKGRPANHPVIVHIADSAQLTSWAKAIPEDAYTLTKHFWPGPLTLVLEKADNVNTIVTGGKNTIGLRAPHHPIAQQILQAFHGGLAAPSANRFCQLSPTTQEAVEHAFNDEISYIVPGEPSQIGVESTILDLTQIPYTILRPGTIIASEIKKQTGINVVYAQQDATQTPGNLPRHYAPNTPAYLVPHIDTSKIDKNTGVISFASAPKFNHWKQLPNNPAAYAQQLYETLRQLDQQNLKAIYIEQPPKNEAWTAINDRLKRLAKRQ